MKNLHVFLMPILVLVIGPPLVNAQEKKLNASDLAKVESALSFMDNRSGVKCSNCHEGILGRKSGLLGMTLDDARSYLKFNLGSHGRFEELSAESIGVACGDYRVAELSDSLLRTHLRLGKRPALVVLNAQTQNGSSFVFETGDVLLTANEEPLGNVQIFRDRIYQAPQAKVEFKLIRQGREIDQTVLASDLGIAPKVYLIGIRIEALSSALRSQLNLPEKQGLLVTEVLDESPAKAIGLQVHDILLGVNDAILSSLDDLKSCLSKSQGNEVQITFMRKGLEMSLKVKPYQEGEKHVVLALRLSGFGGVDVIDMDRRGMGGMGMGGMGMGMGSMGMGSMGMGSMGMGSMGEGSMYGGMGIGPEEAYIIEWSERCPALGHRERAAPNKKSETNEK